MAVRPWYTTIFSGLAWQAWRRSVPHRRTLAEADLIADVLDLSEGDEILDVPCGDGRLGVELAERGYRVVGVDHSPSLLELAERSGAGLPLTLIRADMRRMSFDRRFSGAYCLGNSFGYFQPSGNRAFLQAVARSLAPGAGFLLHTDMIAECLLPLERRVQFSSGDIEVTADNAYDSESGRLETTYRFVRGTAVEEHQVVQWIMGRAALETMLRETGLQPKGAFASTEGEAFESGADEIYLWAVKH